MARSELVVIVNGLIQSGVSSQWQLIGRVSTQFVEELLVRPTTMARRQVPNNAVESCH